MNGKNFFHGNKARIDSNKSVVPRFTNYVINDYKNLDDRVYNRLNDDAEFCKKEVDDNQK